jgi:hypothetical protein
MMKPIKTGSPLRSSASLKGTMNKDDLVEKVRKFHNPHNFDIRGN